MIKDSGQRTEYENGFVRDMSAGKGRFDLIPWLGIWELAKHCEEGAAKYGEHNIDKGCPQHSLLDSAIRHLVKYINGWDDEPHLRAALWNIAWAMQQETTHPEMQDLPARKKEPKMENELKNAIQLIKDYCEGIHAECKECEIREWCSKNTNDCPCVWEGCYDK